MTVYVLTVAGVRAALLVARVTDPLGRPRCRIRVRGEAATRSLPPALVYDSIATARAAWRRAADHRTAVVRAGGKAIRVVDAHLSLELGRAA